MPRRTISPFRQAYRDLLRGIFGPLVAGDAVAANLLDRAERRLGFALPAPLRDVYELAGRHRALTGGHHLLLEPARLRTRDGLLVFLRERQDVCSYGVRLERLGDPDPPVVQRSKQGALHDDAARLTSFLVKNLAWQAIFVLGEGGEGTTSPATLARLAKELETIEHGPPLTYPVQAFRDKGIVVCAFPGPRSVNIYVASKRQTTARRFADRFGLALDEF